MAINETVRDLENFPNVSKTVTLDQSKVVPVDNEGDEIYVLSATPGTGVTKLGGGTINPIFVREFKAGYARSSGLKDAPFTITGTNNTLRISIDGGIVRTITLTNGTSLSGDNVAADLQAQINALGGVGGLEALNLAYLNATVKFINGKFLIVAGSISNTYTGVGRSSVQVLAGLTNDAATTIGFDIYTSSEAISALQAVETSVSSTYTSGGSLSVNSIVGLSAGDAFMITNGVDKEYFVASGISAGTIGISGSGLAHTYSGGSLVQKIFEKDANADLASPYTTVDEITRFALRSVANQINFAA